MVEYINKKIFTLSWQVEGANSCSDSIIGGSNGAITIWQPQFTQDQLALVECGSESIPGRAVRVHRSARGQLDQLAFTALSNGKVFVHKIEQEKIGVKYFKLICEATDLHNSLSDMVFCPQSNSVITCGNDGGISVYNIDRPKKINHLSKSNTSLKCMDIINPNEVMCGDLNGCLRHYDLRTGNFVSFSNQSFSSLLCIQKNPNVNHLAIGGNDQGSIILYDLRNEGSALAEISAHSAAVTNVKYRPRDPNIIYSSSIDGDLFRWSVNNQFLVDHIPRKVESIGDTCDPISIITFDLNDNGDIIYTTDHGAILYSGTISLPAASLAVGMNKF